MDYSDLGLNTKFQSQSSLANREGGGVGLGQIKQVIKQELQAAINGDLISDLQSVGFVRLQFQGPSSSGDKARVGTLNLGAAEGVVTAGTLSGTVQILDSAIKFNHIAGTNIVGTHLQQNIVAGTHIIGNSVVGTHIAGTVAGTVASLVATSTLRANTGYSINGTAGITQTVAGTAGTMTFQNGLLVLFDAI